MTSRLVSFNLYTDKTAGIFASRCFVLNLLWFYYNLIQFEELCFEAKKSSIISTVVFEKSLSLCGNYTDDFFAIFSTKLYGK